MPLSLSLFLQQRSHLLLLILNTFERSLQLNTELVQFLFSTFLASQEILRPVAKIIVSHLNQKKYVQSNDGNQTTEDDSFGSNARTAVPLSADFFNEDLSAQLDLMKRAMPLILLSGIVASDGSK